MAQQQLQRRLEIVRSRAAIGFCPRSCSIVAIVVALATGLGLIDYAIRFRDRGILVIFAASVLVVVAWTVYRLLVRFHAAGLGNTQLALQVEAYFPTLKYRLASAWSFSNSPKPTPAPARRPHRWAIAQAAAECDDIDFGAALNVQAGVPRRWRVAVRLLAGGLVLLNPAAARTALTRLALPLGGDVWPQKSTSSSRPSRTRRTGPAAGNRSR